ncbi:MAG: 3-phosphoserine/phosphohydroxythreonine transaminase [Candidatus Eisenbacteria bacterium]|uniref:Phosphoserine aminotransferase n=1 Tax=Eiseniibacteriota bacterium TaxID=2212470 RepID=A0A956SHT6_UNCEI|nr:3-phosphoserine/phosphohydroxythreonine transaminase [Candidatus Eisenbacteria bacterium]
MARIWNFSAGPATLPVSALERAQKEMLDWAGTGMSIMETSHRSKEYEQVHNEAADSFRQLLKLDDDFTVLFLQGGASQQFAVLPMNFLPAGGSADYVNTGVWSKKALAEAKVLGNAREAGTAGPDFTSVVRKDGLDLDPNAAYVHFTSNNTIKGTQYYEIPDCGSTPLVCDMSSDFLWQPFDANRFHMIYAGAQKNIGPAGVTVVLLRKSWLEKANQDIPTIFKYGIHAENNSLYNTPPTFAIYIVRNVLDWVKAEGGLEAMEKRNREKGDLLYSAIEAHGDFYRCPVEKGSRSFMNVVFRLPTEELEAKFVAEAKAAGLSGLKGHRSVGGCRASIYNAMEKAGVQALVDFMEGFAKTNG